MVSMIEGPTPICTSAGPPAAPSGPLSKLIVKGGAGSVASVQMPPPLLYLIVLDTES